MKTQDYTSTASQPWLLSRDILAESGLLGSISLLGPGVEVPTRENIGSKHVVLFVSQGSVTVTVGRSNYILREEEALRISTGKDYSVRNHTNAAAKVLTLEAPIPRPAIPLAVAFP